MASTATISKDRDVDQAPGAEAVATMTAVPVMPPDQPSPEDWDQEGAGSAQQAGSLVRQIFREGWGRVAAATIAGIGGTVVVGAVLWHSIHALERLAQRAVPEGAERIVIASMIAHAVVSIAAVYFGYSMLRAAERLLVPHRLLRDRRDVEVIHAILGINTPSQAISGQLKSTADETVDLVVKVLRASRGNDAKNDKTS